MMNVYLDNASTTMLSQTTKEYLVSLLDVYGNPSSSHSIGEQAKQIILNVRNSIAKFINANSDEIIFTSGGSASNTLAIKGFDIRRNGCVLYSPIAHKSIIMCVKNQTSYPLKVDKNGLISIKELDRLCMMNRFSGSLLVVDYANSEIGTIQSVKEIIDIAHYYGFKVYLDCTGSISTIPIDVTELDVDMCGFSAHKLGALKGCGVLYKKSDIKLKPIICGSQECGLFGGTENVLGIASLGKAIEKIDYSSITSKNRDYVYNYIIKNISDSYLVGSTENRLPHNLYMCFRGIEGEALVMLLDMDGVQVSTGSACNNNSLSPSNILSAIAMNEDDIFSCIRMSFSGNETIEELDYVCARIKKDVASLRLLK